MNMSTRQMTQMKYKAFIFSGKKNKIGTAVLAENLFKEFMILYMQNSNSTGVQ